MVSHLGLAVAKKLLFATWVTLCTQHAVWVLITYEFHWQCSHTRYVSHCAPHHVVCTYRYWQCSHSQCVSVIVPNSMWCALTDNGSVPTHSIWVSQCPTACDVHLQMLTVFPPTMCEFYKALQHVLYRYWQCFHSQCVSFTVPHSTWCTHCNLGRDILTSSTSFMVICWIVMCNSSLIHYILLSSIMLGDVP